MTLDRGRNDLQPTNTCQPGALAKGLQIPTPTGLSRAAPPCLKVPLTGQRKTSLILRLYRTIPLCSSQPPTPQNYEVAPNPMACNGSSYVRAQILICPS